MMRAARFVAVSFTTLLILFAPGLAFADEQLGSPCAPTDEQRAAYAEDGTLDARTAFQERLGNDEPSAGLVKQAIAREQANNGIAASSVPGEDGGMATVGTAHVLALRVSFPDQQFDENDTLDALQALIGPRAEGESALPSSGPFPYENLHEYYLRASYGKLSVTGEALDYAAQHERAYYAANVGQLFSEALAYLDEQPDVDLGRFDGNGDGRIDAVYLHFAGPDTGWGSVWWSNEQVFGGETATYANETVRLWNGVMLATPCDRAWAAQTIIHETGHVLGLPDFYSYLSQRGESTGRTGILTFDMMMQNQGDHNGFSKWMLGWLPDDKVTRVFANERGIDVKRGGAVVQHVDAAEDGSSSIEEALAAFTSDNVGETGGVIVLSNEDKSMFSSYYLLQYDRFAGNQSVRYEGNGQPTQLPSGFRLFRVQAELAETGSLAHSNTAGSVHDQLIELVDPDMGVAHGEGDMTVPTAIGAGTYGCMLLAGDEMTPKGYPSTNFFENVNVGFTGLTLAVKESGAESGRIAISYSNADKPGDPADFSLTPAFDSFSNVDTLTFNASSQPLLATPLPAAVQLMVDGEPHALLDIDVDGTAVSLPCLLDASSIKPTSTCEIVFPAGLFMLSRSEGETTYSPEIRLSITPDPSMTTTSRSGLYEGTAYGADTSALSNVFTSADGAKRFFQIADGVLKLHTIDPQDASRIASVDVGNAPLAGSDGEQRLNATALSDATAFLMRYNANGTGASTGCWIDLKQGRATASCSIDQAYAMPFASNSSSVVVASYYQGIPGPDEARGGLLLASLTPQADGTVEARYGWTAAQVAAPVSLNALALTFLDKGGTLAEETRVVEATNLVEALAQSTSTPDDAGLAGEVGTVERSAAVLPLASSRMVLDATYANGDYYVLLGADFTQFEPGNALSNTVIRFDASGNERSRFVVSIPDGNPYGRLRVARYGAVALLRSEASPKHGIALTDALFCATDGQVLSTLTTASTATGTWLSDGTWLDVGTSIAGSFGPKGSPVEPGRERSEGGEEADAKARYTITTVLDKAPIDPGDDPEKPVDPQPLPQSDNQGNGGPKPLAPTGDATGSAALATCAAIALAGGVLMRRRRGWRKDDRDGPRYL